MHLDALDAPERLLGASSGIEGSTRRNSPGRGVTLPLRRDTYDSSSEPVRGACYVTRPPSQTELAVALDVTSHQSLVDLTHVLLNVNEFVYVD